MRQRLPRAADLRSRVSSPDPTLCLCDFDAGLPQAAPAFLCRENVVDAENDPALDWLGLPVDCHTCPHRAFLEDGQCRPAHTCILDRRIKHMDRFLRKHQSMADGFLDHPYFELRAVAAKHASLFRIAPMVNDLEPEVRMTVVARLPYERVKHLANDPDRRVRIGVALKMEGQALIARLGDSDYHVRVVIVRKLSPDLLPIAMHDPEPTVRRWVARRIVENRLIDMRHDKHPMVRLDVAERMAPESLSLFVDDPDLRVRFVAAERIGLDQVALFKDDSESIIRDLVAQRLREGEQSTALKIVLSPGDPLSPLA